MIKTANFILFDIRYLWRVWYMWSWVKAFDLDAYNQKREDARMEAAIGCMGVGI